MIRNAVSVAIRRLPRVLVVEDEPLVRFSIAEALRDLDIVVVEAASADEAWTYLRNEGGVGVVFADNDLTGPMSGSALGRGIDEEFPDIRFVLTSGREAIDGWTGSLVAKPYDVAATAFLLAQMAEMTTRHDRDTEDGRERASRRG